MLTYKQYTGLSFSTTTTIMTTHNLVGNENQGVKFFNALLKSEDAPSDGCYVWWTTAQQGLTM